MNIFTDWKDKLSGFVDVRLNLIKLGFIERTSSLLGTIMYSFILLFFSLAMLIFLGIAVEEVFADVLHSRIAGAFCAIGFYVLLALFIVSMRKTIIKLFTGLFIGILTDQGDIDKKPEGDAIKVD